MHICLGTTPALQRTLRFDRVVINEVNRTTKIGQAASGKPLNVARVLHTLGEKAVACVPLGGMTGKFILDDLEAAGIEREIVELPTASRICTTVIDLAGKTATELVEEAGAIHPAQTQALLAALARRLIGAGSVIFSGSLAAGVPDDFYLRCCMAAREKSVAVFLDARGEAFLQALAAGPFVAKLNGHELSDTLGKPIEDEVALKQAMIYLQKQGPAWVIVTLGKQGAVACDGKSFWRVSALKIQAISPIGSGDAFMAGLAAGNRRRQSIPDACRLATAAAAANAMIPGAGNLKLEDVVRLEPLVRVERV
jgi:tagatose 6-phosphate kinase